MTSPNTETSLVASIAQQERRANPRVNMARPLRLARPLGPEIKEEVQSTSNTSRNGLYFRTRSGHYCVGMRVSVMVGYALNNRGNITSFGQVVRIDRLKDGAFGIAVQIQMR